MSLSTPQLPRDVQEAPHRFEPFEAALALEKSETTSVQIKEVVTNRYCPTPVTAVRQNGDQTILETAFLSLLGPLSPLPPAYTELALREKRQGSEAYGDFIDLFVERLTRHYLQTHEKYRLAAATAHHGSGAGNAIASVFRALIGLLPDSLHTRMMTDDEDFLPFAGLLADRTRSAAGLEVLVSGLFHLPVKVSSFSPRWIAIAPEEQTRLIGPSPQYGRLGVDAIAGARLRDAQGSFRLTLGPVDAEMFEALSPDAPLMRRLCEVVRFYVGTELTFDVQVVLAREHVPACRLGGPRPKLGWNSWLLSHPASHDAADALFSPDTASSSS